MTSNNCDYFLHLAKSEGTKIWEQVDAYLYKNYKNVVNADGSRRYDDNRFCMCDGMVDMEFTTLPKNDLSYVARLAGVNIPAMTTGFCGKPVGMLTVKTGKTAVGWQDGYVFTGRKLATAA